MAEDPKKKPGFDGAHEREGYDPVAYHRDETVLRKKRTDARGESALGSMIAAAGIVWGAYVGTDHFTSMQNISLPRGPIELACLGIAIWLHAKWRAR